MNFTDKLRNAWMSRRSMVCVGLDPDLTKLPDSVRKADHPIFEFNRRIIDATCDLVCAYKPQAAYYAGQDADGDLAMTMDYIRERCPDVPSILDVKRGDIGATAAMYAREAFDRYGADAATVNPYMGLDAVRPFLDRADKGVFILCRTSNPSSGDLQALKADGRTICEHVAALASTRWNYNGNAALVVGATYPDELRRVRALCPDLPLLVPGVGAQRGDVAAAVRNGTDADGWGLVVNSSRAIIYASSGDDFAEAAARAAAELRDRINECRAVGGAA